MELKISVSEAVELIKEIKTMPEKIFNYIESSLRESVGSFLSELMQQELTVHLGRQRYERKQDSKNYRNGTYPREFYLKNIGQVEVKVPRDRNGEFKSKVLPRSKRYEDRLREDISAMYLTGISTRTLSILSKKLIGRKISHEEVSKATEKMKEAVENWRTRDVSSEEIKYLFIDGVNFRMRVGGSVQIVPVLVVIGVRDDNTRCVLCLQSGDKESATAWREVFKDLKSRGLDSNSVRLGVMDGLTGLQVVFKEEFPNAKIQRCQVHVARNILAKVPQKLKKKVADDLRSIFYASSKKKAKEFTKSFIERWGKELPSAVKSLKNSIESCLTFFNFPEQEWISLRSPYIIERLNKEFKRRTKSMEIVAGETSCYLLLAFISLKMEMSWRHTKIGKVHPNLPFYKKFTQEC